MSPAVLSFDVEIPRERAVRGKVIEVNKSFEVGADQFFQHGSRTRLRDVKQRDQLGGDAPNPVLLAVVLQTRFASRNGCWLARRRAST